MVQRPSVKKAAVPAPSPSGMPKPAVPAGKTAPVAAGTKAAPSPGGESARSPTKVAALPAPLSPTKSQKTAPGKPAPIASSPSGSSVRIHVASEPSGARVWINGEERGETPCAVDVEPGSARLVLVHAGYLSSQSTIDVREGTKIDEALKPVEPPMTGEARFRAECKTTGRLPVVVDGKETGILCPFSKMRVEPGTHTIGLFVPATGKVHQKEVTLRPGVRSIVFGD